MAFIDKKNKKDFIHPNSDVIFLPEFNIFSPQPTQDTVEMDMMTEHRPISSIDSKNFIEFNFASAEDEYFRFDKSWFRINMRVNISKPLGIAVLPDDWKKVSTVNNLFNSLFKQIDLSIGDRVITTPYQTYPHKTDIEIKFGRARHAKKTFLSAGFWFEAEDLDTKDGIHQKISGLIQSKEKTDSSKGREFELMGKLHIPLFEQPKAVLGGCKFRMKFIPNDPSFYMLCSNEVNITSVEFTDAVLYLHRSKVKPECLKGHLSTLENRNARYPIRESFVVPITINKGTMDTIIDNVHTGVIPNRAFVGMVDHTAFNGSFRLDPYNYQNFGLENINFYLDGTQYPGIQFSPNFDNGNYTREYLNLFSATNQDNNENHCITLTKEKFTQGNNIFCVNFTPTLTAGYFGSGYVSRLKYGTLRLHLRFKSALEQAITVLVYIDYDSIIEIDKERNPLFFQY